MSQPPKPPAAPTQVGFPGQVPFAQPQYAPTPDQMAPQQFATGFPNYVSPPPSPKNQTPLIVVLFAVIGFVLVA